MVTGWSGGLAAGRATRSCTGSLFAGALLPAPGRKIKLERRDASAKKLHLGLHCRQSKWPCELAGLGFAIMPHRRSRDRNRVNSVFIEIARDSNPTLLHVISMNVEQAAKQLEALGNVTGLSGLLTGGHQCLRLDDHAGWKVLIARPQSASRPRETALRPAGQTAWPRGNRWRGITAPTGEERRSRIELHPSARRGQVNMPQSPEYGHERWAVPPP